MKYIKRIDLEVEPKQRLKLPMNSKILGCGKFNEKPCLWITVEDSNRLIERVFLIVAEGKDIGTMNETKYIGRFEEKAEVGAHTLHVFEE